MKFCEHCGTQLEDNETCTCAEAQTAAAGNSEKKALLWVGGALAALLISILLCVAFVSSKINPFDYTTVSFEGYDTAGVVVVDFNKRELISGIIGEEPASFEDMIEWVTEYDSYESCISYKCSQTENLSNGDKITVTFSITQPANNKIKSCSKDFKVEGLPKIETVDVFKDIEITYEGVSGNASAKIVRKNDTVFLEDCAFSMDDLYNLSSGDEITVTITNVDELVEVHHQIPAVKSKTYTVPKLAEYIKTANQLPIVSIKSIANQFIAERKADLSEKNSLSYTYGEVKYYGTYFGTGKDDSWVAKENKLKIYIYYEEYRNGSYNKTVYMPIEFTNILVNPDGSVNLKFEEGSRATFTTKIEASIEDFKDDYNVTEITMNL